MSQIPREQLVVVGVSYSDSCETETKQYCNHFVLTIWMEELNDGGTRG